MANCLFYLTGEIGFDIKEPRASYGKGKKKKKAVA
jgi:hypothetical protein